MDAKFLRKRKPGNATSSLDRKRRKLDIGSSEPRNMMVNNNLFSSIGKNYINCPPWLNTGSDQETNDFVPQERLQTYKPRFVIHFSALKQKKNDGSSSTSVNTVPSSTSTNENSSSECDTNRQSRTVFNDNSVTQEIPGEEIQNNGEQSDNHASAAPNQSLTPAAPNQSSTSAAPNQSLTSAYFGSECHSNYLRETDASNQSHVRADGRGKNNDGELSSFILCDACEIRQVLCELISDMCLKEGEEKNKSCDNDVSAMPSTNCNSAPEPDLNCQPGSQNSRSDPVCPERSGEENNDSKDVEHHSSGVSGDRCIDAKTKLGGITHNPHGNDVNTMPIIASPTYNNATSPPSTGVDFQSSGNESCSISDTVYSDEGNLAGDSCEDIIAMLVNTMRDSVGIEVDQILDNNAVNPDENGMENTNDSDIKPADDGAATPVPSLPTAVLDSVSFESQSPITNAVNPDENGMENTNDSDIKPADDGAATPVPSLPSAVLDYVSSGSQSSITNAVNPDENGMGNTNYSFTETGDGNLTSNSCEDEKTILVDTLCYDIEIEVDQIEENLNNAATPVPSPPSTVVDSVSSESSISDAVVCPDKNGSENNNSSGTETGEDNLSAFSSDSWKYAETVLVDTVCDVGESEIDKIREKPNSEPSLENDGAATPVPLLPSTVSYISHSPISDTEYPDENGSENNEGSVTGLGEGSLGGELSEHNFVNTETMFGDPICDVNKIGGKLNSETRGNDCPATTIPSQSSTVLDSGSSRSRRSDNNGLGDAADLSDVSGEIVLEGKTSVGLENNPIDRRKIQDSQWSCNNVHSEQGNSKMTTYVTTVTASSMTSKNNGDFRRSPNTNENIWDNVTLHKYREDTSAEPTNQSKVKNSKAPNDDSQSTFQNLFDVCTSDNNASKQSLFQTLNTVNNNSEVSNECPINFLDF